MQKNLRKSSNFNPRSPHGERRSSCSFSSISLIFQPTLPARGATVPKAHSYSVLVISTHAPRTGSDGNRKGKITPKRISTHAPRTGSDRCAAAKRENTSHFNPRSPHGERHSIGQVAFAYCSFQPTLPARGATSGSVISSVGMQFQPTLPARGATWRKAEVLSSM